MQFQFGFGYSSITQGRRQELMEGVFLLFFPSPPLGSRVILSQQGVWGALSGAYLEGSELAPPP